MPEVNDSSDTQPSGELVLEELRRTHDHQLNLIEEADDKAETMVRLGVFTVTGIAIFLTYATRPEASVEFTTFAKVLLLFGAFGQLLAFSSMLHSYGVLGRERGVEIGAELASRRRPEQRDRENVMELLAAGYRKAIKRNAQTYSKTTEQLNFGVFMLFSSAFLYLAVIFISVRI